MQNKPEKDIRFNWSNFLIDAFFILGIFVCLYLFAFRALWDSHSFLVNVIGVIVILAISTVIYYLLKKRDSIYRR
jgi:hypothetical protein